MINLKKLNDNFNPMSFVVNSYSDFLKSDIKYALCKDVGLLNEILKTTKHLTLNDGYIFKNCLILSDYDVDYSNIEEKLSQSLDDLDKSDKVFVYDGFSLDHLGYDYRFYKIINKSELSDDYVVIELSSKHKTLLDFMCYVQEYEYDYKHHIIRHINDINKIKLNFFKARIQAFSHTNSGNSNDMIADIFYLLSFLLSKIKDKLSNDELTQLEFILSEQPKLNKLHKINNRNKAIKDYIQKLLQD